MAEPLRQFGELQHGFEQASPLHGYRGERPRGDGPLLPAALTIAISREAGSRGTSIAQRAGEKLGWQVYTQEMLEYVAQEETVRQDIKADLSSAALEWVDEQLAHLQSGGQIAGGSSVFEMARIILSLGAAGEVVLIGRGAGYILPRESTLHVRVIGRLEDRIAHMGQWQRLTPDEAAAQVATRDRRRAEYMQAHFQRDIADIYQYDLLLNSTLLGEELSADLLVQAGRTKAATLVDRTVG